MTFIPPSLSVVEKNAVHTCFDLLEANNIFSYAAKKDFFAENRKLLSEVPLYQMFKYATQQQFDAIKGNRSYMVGKEFSKWHLCAHVNQRIFFSNHKKILKVKNFLNQREAFQAKLESAESKLKILKATLESLNKNLKEGETEESTSQTKNTFTEIQKQTEIDFSSRSKLKHCSDIEKISEYYNITAAREEYIADVKVTGVEGSRLITDKMVEAQWKLLEIYHRNIRAKQKVEIEVTGDIPSAPVTIKEAIKRYGSAVDAKNKARINLNEANGSIKKNAYIDTKKVMQSQKNINELSTSAYTLACVVSFGFFALYVLFTKLIWCKSIGKVIKIHEAIVSYTNASALVVLTGKQHKTLLLAGRQKALLLAEQEKLGKKQIKKKAIPLSRRIATIPASLLKYMFYPII